MRWSLLLVVGALVALTVRVGAQEGHGGEPGVEVAVEATAQFCTSSIQVLMAEFRVLFSPEEYNMSINCLAFGSERNLENAVISVFRLDGSSSARYNLTCRSNTLRAQQLFGQNASLFNLLEQDYHACLECRPTEVDSAICHDPCPSECERCATIGSEVLCTECYRYRLLNDYPPSPTLTAEQIESEREENEENHREEVCTDDPINDIEDPLNFRCVQECPDFGNHSKVSKEDGKTCFACGIQYCVECEQHEGSRDECLRCIADTVLFEEKCFSCPLALIARTAIVQEEEEREEEEEITRRQIELGVSLPIVCFLVIIFFLAMSVYAHHRYPHVSYKGHKRHRKKPDMFSREASSPAPSSVSEPPVAAVAESGVWRSQPSVRFR